MVDRASRPPRVYKPRGVQAAVVAINIIAALTAVTGLCIWLIAPFVAHTATASGPVADVAWIAFLMTAGAPILLLIAVARPRWRGHALAMTSVLAMGLLILGLLNNAVSRVFLVLGLLAAVGLAIVACTALVGRAMRLADDSYWLDVHRRHGACWSCGYDIRGQREPRCPECGMTVDREA